MQAQKARTASSPAGTTARLCALALVVTCALGLVFSAVGRPVHAHKHAVRGVVAVSAPTGDELPHGPRGESAVVAARGEVETPAGRIAGSVEVYTPVVADPVDAPQGRGPPGSAPV